LLIVQFVIDGCDPLKVLGPAVLLKASYSVRGQLPEVESPRPLRRDDHSVDSAPAVVELSIAPPVELRLRVVECAGDKGGEPLSRATAERAGRTEELSASAGAVAVGNVLEPAGNLRLRPR